ncbi:uncharacterized protein LOC123559696 [Mercenaria mercenaria]|uniref:uncharacterized protein LOC123559696 n=1 Tax=Mercenaria mercenaria TaxID=6596 RepID=UPI00234E3C3A|nr:uncharacterized protein LOC123559696 [Mercenaria mercenaria]
MDEKVYAVRLTDQQVAGIQSLFNQKGWSLELDTIDRYKEKEEIAGDYVEFKPINGRASPIEAETSPAIRRRIRSEPTSHVADDDGERLEAMKKIGATYKQSFKGTFKTGSLRKDVGVPLPGIAESSRAEFSPQGQWRISAAPGSILTEEAEVGTSDIRFNHFLVADDKTIKVLTRLSTEHVHTVSCVPVRIVLLIDRSGSMLHKIGKDSRHTKITKVKHFAKQLIASLDDGDEAGLVTFGEDADVFFPLQKLTAKSRPLLQERLDKLDRDSMSRLTNISAGLRMALKVFFDASKCESDYLERKNSILVFSDGEINAGTTDTNSLLHEVRQSIRQMVPKLDDSQNQWVTISVVTTGSNISEQAYMLSKTCSSDAYYYIKKDAVDPEAELFLPVLLRKSAVAWNISYVIETFHDIKFDSDKCSKDNRIRLRRSISGRGTQNEKAYFMYDFAAGHARQIGIGATWGGETSLQHLPNDETLFKLKVEYTNIKGDRLWQEQLITKEDVIDALYNRPNSETNAAACKHEVQMVSSDVLRYAAEHMKVGDKRKSKAVMLDGQRNLQALLNEFGEKSRQDSQSQNNVQIQMYAKSVVDNLGALISTIEKSSEGESWNKMKAVSTAIVRETPNVSGTVVDSEILCPLPHIDHMGTDAMADPLQRLMAKNKKQKRTTFGLDKLLEDMELT